MINARISRIPTLPNNGKETHGTAIGDAHANGRNRGHQEMRKARRRVTGMQFIFDPTGAPRHRDPDRRGKHVLQRVGPGVHSVFFILDLRIRRMGHIESMHFVRNEPTRRHRSIDLSVSDTSARERQPLQ